MPNIFVITPNTKISYKRLKKSIVLENKENKKEIPVSKIESIFLFNNNSLGILDLKALISKNIHIYWLDNLGHIRKMHIPKKKGYKFNPDRNISILAYIVAKESLYLMSTIKKMDRLQGSIYSSSIRFTLNEFFLKDKYFSEKNVLMVHRENLLCLYSFLSSIGYTDDKFIRKYEKKDKTNVVLNMFHSLTIAYITTLLQKNGVDVNQEISFYKNKNNYPALSRVFFILVRTLVSLRALETYKNLLDKTKKLTIDDMLIISKVFTEKIVHNETFNDRIELLIQELKSVEAGKLNFLDILFSKTVL